jgi:leucyl-tRNA synthetase
MKRTRPKFDALTASDKLQEADFSAEQARGIIRVIQDSQEHMSTLDDLQEPERNANAHTDEQHANAESYADKKHAEAMAATAEIKQSVAELTRKFLELKESVTEVKHQHSNLKTSVKTITAVVAILGTLVAIGYRLYQSLGG